MRFSARTWSLLSLLLFIAAAFFWLKGNEYETRRKQRLAPARTNEAAAQPTGQINFLSTKSVNLARLAPAVAAQSGGIIETNQAYPHRLRNTAKSMDDLVRDDGAILLANALMDTADGRALEIPAHLRAAGDPGSYIVQARGPVDGAFRARLAAEGAEIISYVPNNAYFVKLDAAGAEQLKSAAGVQAVLPFEPYYKLEKSLLARAVAQQALPTDAFLRVTLLPGALDAAGETLGQIAALGAEILEEEPSPFGPQLLIKPEADSLASLAGLAAVQGIEPVTPRKPASDLSRISLGVAQNGVTNANYLDLTGSNIWVNINDIRIETNHPSLSATKIYVPEPPIPMADKDTNGHGTFIAGLIAGSGKDSPSGTNAPFGSATNAVFRGMATNATLLALPVDAGGGGLYPEVTEKLKDSWLIDRAARTNQARPGRTNNTMISNNSWTYGRSDYDSAAARYDAAVRDALPGATDAQPLLFVFAAGNSGFGDEDGTGGLAGSIESPGSAKNVITVGALETFRQITNFYTLTNYVTNADSTITTNTLEVFPFIGLTDSSNEVASFSGRGNVGIDIEGRFGRFKPDVVAPGAMLVSARSSGWTISRTNLGAIELDPAQTNFADLLLSLYTNLEPYRYETGTSLSAANVSGFLALLQEYFERVAPTDARGRMSPALIKALLINGARSVGGGYDVAVQSPVNFQGWGLPSLPLSFSSFSTNSHETIDEKKWRLRFIDQAATNALATGQSRTWNVTLTTNASVYPLRVTLVWTDPPGNPAVAVKLVNDLDLIVTNLDTGTVFYGNNIPDNAEFTDGLRPVAGQVLPLDFVNNVENVFIRNPKQLGREFSITVRGRRVNVNAVSDYLARTGASGTNDLVQDFALAISSEIGADSSQNETNLYYPDEDVWEVWDAPTKYDTNAPPALGIITNGLPLLNERAGASATLIGPNGQTNNWNFYVFTNTYFSNNLVSITNGSNVAFVTFNSANLARPRGSEADIDLYVSKDSRLTNLHPVAVNNAFKSLERGGTETVVFTNAQLDEVYYVGVKAEDQQASEYSLIGVSSDLPFEDEDNGRIILRGVPYNSFLADGAARKPVAGTMLAIGLSNRRVARTVVTNTISHENLGDLVGVLSHNNVRMVLNNHLFVDTGFITNTFVYDDNSFNAQPGTRPSDGPGSLNDFAGFKLTGAWFLEMIDDAPSHTGRVELLTIVIDPLQEQLEVGTPIDASVEPGQTLFFPIEAPANATNMTITISNVFPVGSRLEFFLRREQLPTTNVYDLYTNVVIGSTPFRFTFPASTNDYFTPGEYFLAVRNPGSALVDFTIAINFGITTSTAIKFDEINDVGLLDDATTNQVTDFSRDKVVTQTRVSLRMHHPRASDTLLTLISPQGTRVLLAENRGGSNTLGYGPIVIRTNITGNPAVTNVLTNFYYAVFTDDTNLARVPVKLANLGSQVGLTAGGSTLTNGFEGARDGNYTNGAALSAWTVIASPSDTNTAFADQVSVITGSSYAYTGTNTLSLGNAGVRASFPARRDLTYKLVFAARAAKPMDLFSTGLNDAKLPLGEGEIDPHYRLITSPHPQFRGPDAYMLDTNGTPFTPPVSWTPNSVNSQWIAPYPEIPASVGDGDGIYVFRTYINLYEQDPRNAPIPIFKWAADEVGDVLLNGRRLGYTSAAQNVFNTAVTYQLGGLVYGLNIVDFEVEDLEDAEGMRLQVVPGINTTNKLANPQFDVRVGAANSALRTFTATADWSIYTIDFAPSATNQVLEFLARSGEVWIDAVAIGASEDIYVQPEEPLEILEGERAIGEWALEVRDARTGAVLPTGDYVTWRLEVNLADPFAFAEQLANDRIYGQGFPNAKNSTNRITAGTIFTNQVHYFIVTPCPGDTEINVVLTGLGNFDAIDLLMDHSGIPTGDPETDDFVLMRNNENPGRANGILEFNLTDALPSPARLNGKPFFIAVRNRYLESTNRYTLEVFGDTSCLAPPPPPFLARGGSFSGGLPSFRASMPSAGALYQVQVAGGAQSVAFNVAADEDAMIVARRGEPPTREAFSHSANQPGSGQEQLVINGQSDPPLTPGIWYVRVLNNASIPSFYTITAEGDLAGDDVPNITAVAVSGQIVLTWNSTEGKQYEIQASSNLADWAAVGSVTPGGGSESFSAPMSGLGQFYRVVLK